MKLKPFDPQAKCCKCGSEHISTCFHEVVQLPDGPWGKKCHYGEVCYCDCDGASHIVRSCRRCGYEWCELPLDEVG